MAGEEHQEDDGARSLHAVRVGLERHPNVAEHARGPEDVLWRGPKGLWAKGLHRTSGRDTIHYVLNHFVFSLRMHRGLGDRHPVMLEG